MDNKINNKPVTIAKSIDMNDYDYLKTLLEMEKHICEYLTTYLNEVSCDKLFNAIFLLLTETNGMERDIFNMIFDCGWYSFETANKNNLQESLNYFDNNINQLL